MKSEYIDIMGTDEVDIDCVSKLGILSHQTRLNVVRALMLGPATVTELLRLIPIEQNLMSHHLRLLREGGIVATDRVGKSIRYFLPDTVKGDQDNEVDLGCCRLSF